MAQKEKKKTCIYSCLEKCMETARFLEGPSAAAALAAQGVAGYDLVYIADLQRRQIFMFGNPSGAGKTPLPDTAQPVHEQAHARAAQGEVLSYEWSLNWGEKTCFYQTTLLPLRDQAGQVGSLLGLVRNITAWAQRQGHEQFLKEVSGRTFPQILLMAREQERKNISAALHDEIGSAAVALTSLLSLVKQDVQEANSAQALKDIAALDRQIKDSIERVKNIVVSLRPPNLEAVSLAEAVRDMVDNVARYRGLRHRCKVPHGEEGPLSDEVKIVLYRVAQESLNNIVKHARATRVDVELKLLAHDVILTVRDDGKGFKTASQRSIKHIGLLSMRDSVAYLGGKFTIQSQPGRGTVVQVQCPRVVYGEKR